MPGGKAAWTDSSVHGLEAVALDQAGIGRALPGADQAERIARREAVAGRGGEAVHAGRRCQLASPNRSVDCRLSDCVRKAVSVKLVRCPRYVTDRSDVRVSARVASSELLVGQHRVVADGRTTLQVGGLERRAEDLAHDVLAAVSGMTAGARGAGGAARSPPRASTSVRCGTRKTARASCRSNACRHRAENTMHAATASTRCGHRRSCGSPCRCPARRCGRRRRVRSGAVRCRGTTAARRRRDRRCVRACWPYATRWRLASSPQPEAGRCDRSGRPARWWWTNHRRSSPWRARCRARLCTL